LSGVIESKPLPPLRIDIPRVLDKRLNHLYDGIRSALLALPSYFSFPHPISGVKATDLFNLNSLIGAAIEDQVVMTLNKMRNVWDDNNEWEECYFVRSSQAFPDVRLIRRTTDLRMETILGIELKGWYVLSKEGVPSMRYQVSYKACSAQDLVCVVPWYLDNAVCGEAKVMTPWIEQARYAAEWRDYWWQYVRNSRDTVEERAVEQPDYAAPYPSKADLSSARPVKDRGDNFGRLPRCKPLMDDFTASTLEQEILGIAARDWVAFLLAHAESANPEDVILALNNQLEAIRKPLAEQQAEELLGLLRMLTTKFDFGETTYS
jgi:hypothetical protein